MTPDMRALCLVLIPRTDLSIGDLRLMLELAEAPRLMFSRLVIRWPRLPRWVFMLWFLSRYWWRWWQVPGVRAQSGRLEVPISSSPRAKPPTASGQSASVKMILGLGELWKFGSESDLEIQSYVHPYYNFLYRQALAKHTQSNSCLHTSCGQMSNKSIRCQRCQRTTLEFPPVFVWPPAAWGVMET